MKKILAIIACITIGTNTYGQIVPPVTFTQATYEGREGTSVRLQIKLNRPATKTMRVTLQFKGETARVGADFTTAAPTVTFYKNGLQTKSIIIPLKIDSSAESRETFSVVVTSIDNKKITGNSVPKAQVVILDAQSGTSTNPGNPGNTPGTVGSAGYVWKTHNGPNFSPIPPACNVVPNIGSACNPNTQNACIQGGTTYTCVQPSAIPGSYIVECLAPLASRNCGGVNISNNAILEEYDYYTITGSVQNLAGTRLSSVKTSLLLTGFLSTLGRPQGGFYSNEKTTSVSDSSGNVQYKVLMNTGKSIRASGEQARGGKSISEIRTDVQSAFGKYGATTRNFLAEGGRDNIFPGTTNLTLTHIEGNTFKANEKIPFVDMGPVSEYQSAGSFDTLSQQGNIYFPVSQNAKYCKVSYAIPPTESNILARYNAMQGNGIIASQDIAYGSCSFLEAYKPFSDISGAVYEQSNNRWKLLNGVPGNFIIDGTRIYQGGI